VERLLHKSLKKEIQPLTFAKPTNRSRKTL
jgi:hypothetical protein